MPYLALDTSAGLAVAVVDDDLPAWTTPPRDGAVLVRAVDPQPRRHAEDLTPRIAEVLGSAGLSVHDLTGVVVGTGPAQFTGLRAGLVTARTLGYALGVPVLGAASLSAVALQAFALIDPSADGATSAGSPDAAGTAHQVVVVATDARRHEVYWARYARDRQLGVRLVDGPGVAAPGDVPTQGAVLAGRGAPLLPGSHDGSPPDAPHSDVLAALDPDPVALWAVATALRAHGEPTPVEPLYLRRPDAVPAAGAKRVGR